MTKIYNQQWSMERRRSMRSEMTAPEKMLWNAIRGEFLGVKFRRQHNIGPYIADFYSPKRRLVLEIDGDSHADTSARIYDAERDSFMRELNITVLRFSNHDVMTNIDGVTERIQDSLSLPLTKGESEGV